MTAPEVLIVGGGPIGLTCSILLSRLGLANRVVERNAGLHAAPQAHVVSARTMEIFRAAGIDDGGIRAAATPVADLAIVVWTHTLAGPELGRLRLATPERAAKMLAAGPEPFANISQHLLEPILLEEARRKLAEAEAAREKQADLASEAQKQQELLNRQVASLRQQLGELRALLDDAKAREAAANVQIESLGQDLNVALARAAAEERRRRQLEEEKARRLEEERNALQAQNEDLEKYRSDFFGRLREVLGDQEGVRIVGDRFVFSSEVLFAPAEADLEEAGKDEIAKVVDILRSVADDIPEGIDWVLQVDGHTDDKPIRNSRNFADNWELSQARALSVVRYMIDDLGMDPERLSANGFGEYQPVNTADTDEARAQNRRIELKITEK